MKKNKMIGMLIGVGSIISSSTVYAQETSAARGCAVDMPSGYGWPANSSEILKISKNVDIKKQRQHGWNLFAAVTQPSISNKPDSLPIFATWYSGDETFDKKPGKIECSERVKTLKFEPSTQFLLSSNNQITEILEKNNKDSVLRFDPDVSLLLDENSAAEAIEESAAAVFSHVAFNQELYDYIRDNKYYSRKELNSLIDPNRVRKPVKSPPKNSVSLKTSWWPVASNGGTPVPVWDFDPRFPGEAKNYPKDWKRVVVVDTKGNLGDVDSVMFNKRKFNSPNVVGLDKFYAVKLTAEEAENANSNWRIKSAAKLVMGRSLQENDYVVMLAMHINTNEFSPWVFTSFWWHDRPNVGEWSENRTSKVKGKWRNYLMGVDYNINTPREPDGKADIVYNPYLELFQKGGMQSACMACHARAGYSSPKGMRASYNPKERGTTDPDGFEPIPDGENDPAFQKGTLNLHTIWTINTRSR